MDVSAFVDQIRDHYVSAYQEAAENHRKKNSISIMEGIIELPKKDGIPNAFRLWRMDLAAKVDGEAKFSEFNHDSHLQFSPFHFTYSKQLNVKMNPVSWNGVEFEYSDSDIDTNLFENWANKWIDVEEKLGLGGYVHNITYPECKDGECTFSVDFGSASAYSFFELLEVFANYKIENVTVHSRTAHGQS